MSLSMDPRALPKFQDPENSELIADYEVELNRLNEILATTSTPGWSYLLEGFRRDLALVEKRMAQEDSKGAWKLLRGKSEALLDIITLPDRVQATRLRVLEDYRRLTDQEEE